MGKYKCRNWEWVACYYVFSEKCDITHLLIQMFSTFYILIIHKSLSLK